MKVPTPRERQWGGKTKHGGKMKGGGERRKQRKNHYDRTHELKVVKGMVVHNMLQDDHMQDAEAVTRSRRYAHSIHNSHIFGYTVYHHKKTRR